MLIVVLARMSRQPALSHIQGRSTSTLRIRGR